MDRPESVTRDDYLAAMRGVACSVTIVTTDGLAGRHGATVSAFSSVSADPPSVLICLKTNSRIEQAVRRNGNYGVNILPETACALAKRFAGDDDGILTDRFDGIEFETVENGGPRFPDTTYLNCLLSDAIVHASHTILIGVVRNVSVAHSTPLTYLDGDFHHIRPRAGYRRSAARN